jgi:SAM-dependent methyltransferase
VLVADAAHLPVADGSVSVVLAMHMLYHLADPEAGVAELARVLVPGGLVVVSTNHSRDKRELDELWQAAARDVLGATQVPARVSLSSRFPLDTAAGRLREHFTDLELIDLGGVIEVPVPGPVVAHLASYRAWADQVGVPF